jgi:pyruvate formate lyase activating enzyme
MRSGLIFDIKRYSINDGPGIRVTFFLKGCVMHCGWCHNPESISSGVEKMYLPEKCIGCGACGEACPEKACVLTPRGVVTDPELCTGCGVCAEVCPSRATEMSGRKVTVDEILSIVEKERIFFDQSGGGVTFSGGEPLLQADFLKHALDVLGRESVHRAVDTTGFCKTEILLEVAGRTDLFLYDLKVMDPERHKRWTGVENGLILSNLQTLAAAGANIDIRIPLIHGVNADEENIVRTAAFVAGLEGETKKVSLLPYHDIMTTKYRKLGRSFDAAGLAEPAQGELERAISRFADFGVMASVGG